MTNRLDRDHLEMPSSPAGDSQQKGAGMLVKNWMSRNIITVNSGDTMVHATKLMKDHQIGLLPVLENGVLVGVVSDGDLKRASASSATTLEVHELLYLLARTTVREIMTRNPITVPVDWTLEETAELLLERNIEGVPVFDDSGALVGIVTQTDLLRAFLSLVGQNRRGIQFAFLLTDSAGSIRNVTDVIRASGGRLASIMSSYDNVPAGFRKVYITVYSIDRQKLAHLAEELRTKAERLFYMVDFREKKRKFMTRHLPD